MSTATANKAMCSQPPKDVDDTYIYAELERAVPLIDKETHEIGITGGEPTLGGERFLNLLRSLRDHLPRTAVHVLSNGRRFIDPGFAAAYAGTGHHDIMIGIPIYADYAALHDYVVQSDGAFDETIRGRGHHGAGRNGLGVRSVQPRLRPRRGGGSSGQARCACAPVRAALGMAGAT